MANIIGRLLVTAARKGGNMTESQKQAQETRRRNKEAQDARARAYRAQEAIDKPLMLDALRAVLRNPNSTPAQLIFAVSVLDSVKVYHVVPYGVKYPAGPDSRDVDAISEELRAKIASIAKE